MIFYGTLQKLGQSVCESATARKNARNAFYGAAEYVALPLAMLAATPFLLYRLGLAAFGVWMLASAAVTTSNLISNGFGDAALKYASLYRGQQNEVKFENALRASLTINLALGAAFAALLWGASPFAVNRIFRVDPALHAAAITAFRIGSGILMLRCVESVLISALRSHERYGPAVQINIASRVGMVVTACVLVWRGQGIAAIMAATLAIVAGSVLVQAAVVRTLIGRIRLLPSFERAAFAEVFQFGCFSWLQAVAGCIFSQADKLLIGALLGTPAVGVYSVCVQAAQPIHGLLAAGLHCFFPHLGARLATTPTAQLRSLVHIVLVLNAMSAAALCIPVVVFSRLILRLWMGAGFAGQTWAVLSIVALGFGFLSLNVTGHYALLALGQVRLVAAVNLIGGGAMIAAIFLLTPRFGLAGAAAGRLLYGPVTLLMYGRLHRLLSPGASDPSTPFPAAVITATQSQ